MTRIALVPLAISTLLAAACGHKIGDECTLNADCASDGSRICDTFTLHGGYCTISGCDFGTCPDEAICVRFNPALEDATSCANLGQVECGSDEICNLERKCAPRSLELRFC